MRSPLITTSFPDLMQSQLGQGTPTLVLKHASSGATFGVSLYGGHFRHDPNTEPVNNRIRPQGTAALLWCFPPVLQFLRLFSNIFFLAYSFLPVGPL